MNAPRLAALLVGHSARLRTPAVALALALVLAAACSIAPVGKSATQPKPVVSCPDLVAQQVTSQGAVVPGAYACLDAAYQERATSAFTDAAGFATFAANLPLALDARCGHYAPQGLSIVDRPVGSAGVYVYVVHDPQGNSQGLLIEPDAAGKVADIGLLADLNACPKH